MKEDVRQGVGGLSAAAAAALLAVFAHDLSEMVFVALMLVAGLIAFVSLGTIAYALLSPRKE